MVEDKNIEGKTVEASFITKASARYCDKFPLRAAIQAIPVLGSSLDTMLAGLGARYQYERLEDFIFKLNEKMKQVKKSGHLTSAELSEPFFDLMMQVFDQAIRTRSEEKRKRFANLVTNQFINQSDWDEAETACRLLGDLSDLHIQVLSVFEYVKKHDAENHGELTVSDRWSNSEDFDNDKRKRVRRPDLRPHFPSLSNSAILMICSELVSKGLLHDIGVGRMEVGAMEIFVATDLAKWLMEWISEPVEESHNE